MALRFFETMQGELNDAHGRPQPIVFEMQAHAEHSAALLKTPGAKISGIIWAPPWLDDCPFDGFLLVSPLDGRFIKYRIRVRDDDENDFEFEGQKDLNPLRLLHSMTHMRVKLKKNGHLVAKGKMYFALGDLPEFLRAWQMFFLGHDDERKGKIWKNANRPGPLNTTDSTTFVQLKTYASAMLGLPEQKAELDHERLDFLQKMLSVGPSAIPLAFRASLKLLDLSSLWHQHKKFADLGVSQRRIVVDKMQQGRPGRSLNALLSTPIKMAYANSESELHAAGIPQAEAVTEQSPRYMQLVHQAEHLDVENDLQADVVIIGTGAGGAPLAARLAEAGHAVAMIEAGPYARRPDFARPVTERLLEYWEQAGMQSSLGVVPIGIPTGQLVGGTTAINSGTCLSPPEEILQAWQDDLGLPGDFSRARMQPYIDRVKSELEVTKADKRWLGDGAEIVARGAEFLGLEHGPLARNAPACDGQGQCVFGCPSDAKRSTNVSYVPRALKAGAHLFTEMRVDKLLRRGQRVHAIEAHGRSADGRQIRLRIKARVVIIAAGTLKSPLLLHHNGFKFAELGKNLSVHPALGLSFRSAQISNPWRAIPQGYGFKDQALPRLHFEGFYTPPPLASSALPLVGSKLHDWIEHQGQVSQFGFLVRDQAIGRVFAGPGGKAIIRYPVNDWLVGQLQGGMSRLAEVLIRGGAEKVSGGHSLVGEITTLDQARSLATAKLKATDFRIMAFHPLGTCRLASTAEQGVVDAEHKVFGTSNLYIVDGSTVPGPLGVNPQITIMALSERLADILQSKL